MKILAIRIKNLASLEGITEIDFSSEPLSSAGIFAITGATGAGKSTILDALCLALYGKTPRYLQAKEMGIEVHDVGGSTIAQGDVRGILRDGTAEGSAEVDFVGIDARPYRATWNVRRARNKAEGSVQPDSIGLKNITTLMDFPGKKAETYREIERLVGLNFEQFTRSVLLAQGDFTAFMKANKDEKSSLLEKLTGTHIYSEISKKIYEKYKLEEQQLRDLNLQKDGVHTLGEDELKALHHERTDLEAQIKTLEKEIDHLAKEINWHDQLAQFQNSLEAAESILLAADQAKAKAVHRKQKLFLVEQAQKTRNWSDTLKHAQEQHAVKTASLLNLKEHIGTLDREGEALEKRLSDLETDLDIKNKALADALPLLAQAKKLDTLLSEKKEQLAKAREEVVLASEKYDRHHRSLEEKQRESTGLLEEIRTLEEWKAKNMDRSPVVQHKDLILSKLRDAQNLLNILQTSSMELGALQEKIQTKEAQKVGSKADLDRLQLEWESLKKGYDTRSKALLPIPIETLNMEKNETDLAFNNIILAQAHWQLLHNLETDFKTLDQKRSKDRSDLDIKGKTLEHLVQQLAVARTKKETSAQMLQQARLASTENVGILRRGLTDNEPCPVCGSKDHPYSEHSPQLEGVLTALESAHKTNEEAYLSTFRQHSGLEQECRTLENNILNQDRDLAARRSALDVKKTEWEQFDIAKESNTIPDGKKTDWIEKRLQALKTKQLQLQAGIRQHTAEKLQLEADKSRLDGIKETLDALNDRIKDTDADLALYGEQWISHNKENEKARKALKEIKEMLSPYFKGSDWMENWRKEPVAFIESISAFAQKWKENIENLEHHNRQLDILSATLKEFGIQDKNLSTEVSQKTGAYTIQDKNYRELEHRRNAMFNGKSAEDVESRMKQAIIEAQQQLDGVKMHLQQLAIDRTRANTQQDDVLAILTRSAEDIRNVSQKIQTWIEDYNQRQQGNLNMEELQEVLLLTGDWIDFERSELQAIDEKMTRATSVLAERKQLLEAHRQKSLSDRSLDELEVLSITTKNEAEQKKHTKGQIGFKLQQNEINKNKIGDLLKSIAVQAAIAENWSKLNEVIGSADGKKFRQIAQEYTLDVLLGYANIHLQALTDRYRMERIPATLGLQVVDQDMGDEVRTVYSLSGGESFLVSLALALGLASLSSSKMKVESLFIDEGFGSLDPTTLNIAMDALERLHNQGRKVGVISHVQEMTERIPVQIKVSKMASGKSKVEVLGNY